MATDPSSSTPHNNNDEYPDPIPEPPPGEWDLLRPSGTLIPSTASPTSRSGPSN
jgi:hypothetical protein